MSRISKKLLKFLGENLLLPIFSRCSLFSSSAFSFKPQVRTRYVEIICKKELATLFSRPGCGIKCHDLTLRQEKPVSHVVLIRVFQRIIFRAAVPTSVVRKGHHLLRFLRDVYNARKKGSNKIKTPMKMRCSKQKLT